MEEPDKTNDVSNDKKDQILKEKKKLLEIYALVSGLIITSIQATSSLIAINTSVNGTAYNDTISATKTIIEYSNLAFFLFIFLILLYYTKTFDDDLLFTTFLVTSISIFFSYILINFVDLYAHLSLIVYFGLLFFIFIAMLLTLVQNSILMVELENKTSEIAKLRNIIYGLTPKTFKTTLNKLRLLKIWRSIIIIVILYIIYFIIMAVLSLKNHQLYDILTSPQTDVFIILWIISSMLLFKIFTVILTL